MTDHPATVAPRTLAAKELVRGQASISTPFQCRAHSSTGRIDAIVASIIGLSRVLDDGGRSIYETRGLLVL
ncbi:MAG: hypothetical protein AB7O68_09260 [Pirellulales bacterium]